MGNGSGARDQARFEARRFAAQVELWVQENEALVSGLVALRDLEDSEHAVAAILSLRCVRRFVLSWELWLALFAVDDPNPDDLLVQAMPTDLRRRCRLAFWGIAEGVGP